MMNVTGSQRVDANTAWRRPSTKEKVIISKPKAGCVQRKHRHVAGNPNAHIASQSATQRSMTAA